MTKPSYPVSHFATRIFPERGCLSPKLFRKQHIVTIQVLYELPSGAQPTEFPRGAGAAIRCMNNENLLSVLFRKGVGDVSSLISGAIIDDHDLYRVIVLREYALYRFP